MQKFALTLATAAACTLGASLTAQAGAIKPAQLGAALDQIRVVEPVHCIPGRVHRRSPPYDGCYRTTRRYYAPQPYAYSPYPYGYRQYYYGSPGISFGFGTGYHHRGYGFGWGF